MLSEKEMEDAIVANPKRYLGEDGLELIERQYRIGGYIFDLLFRDRHGAKLIVEIQKGTLDRQHTYKILDYYDGFREKHPNDFIELMVIANQVPEERKKRLRFWGVEYREVPLSEFINLKCSQTAVSEPTITHVSPVVKDESNKIDCSMLDKYRLFKEQKNRFVEALLNLDPDADIRLNWSDLNQKNISECKNWFICFAPSSWGYFRPKSFGIHFGFSVFRDKNDGLLHVRLPVGVEKPLKFEFREQFKKDVVDSLAQQNVCLEHCHVWPDVGFQRRKLIEPEPVKLDDFCWEHAINRYVALDGFIKVVADQIRKYNDRGCFDAILLRG